MENKYALLKHVSNQPTPSVPPSVQVSDEAKGSHIYYILEHQLYELDGLKAFEGWLCVSSDLNYNFFKEKTVLCFIDKETVIAQNLIVQELPMSLQYYYYEDVRGYMFVDSILLTWYEALDDAYDNYIASSLVKGIKAISWVQFIYPAICPLLQLLCSWMILALKKNYKHRNLLGRIFFQNICSPKLIICSDYKVDLSEDPLFYKEDLLVMGHILYVVANRRPSADLLLNPKDYKYDGGFNLDGGFNPGVSNFIKSLESFYGSLLTLSLNMDIFDIVLSPCFIRKSAQKVHYFRNLLRYIYETANQERVAFDNHPEMQWIDKLKNDKGMLGEFFRRSNSKVGTPYLDNWNVLRLFRNAIEHMAEELGVPEINHEVILAFFEDMLRFFGMIHKMVCLRAKYLQANSDVRGLEAFRKALNSD